MKQTTIIGLTGTHGSGKGTVVEYLMTRGFRHFSATELLREEALKRGLPLGRPSYSLMANTLRQESGPGYIMRALYEKARAADGPAVIEAVYTVGEVNTLRALAHEHGQNFLLLATDADPHLRYQRIFFGRKGDKDNITFQEFERHEREEMASTDPDKQNLAACRTVADLVFMNNATKEDLFAELDARLKL